MREYILFFLYIITFAIGITACNSFGGVATDPGETTTTNLNLPGDKIVPYDNPELDKSKLPKEKDLCSGVPSKNGFKCNP